MTCLERWSRVLDSQMGGEHTAYRKALAWLVNASSGFRVRILVPVDHADALQMSAVLTTLLKRYGIAVEVEEGMRATPTVPQHFDVDMIVVLALSSELQAFCFAFLASENRDTAERPQLLACIRDGTTDEYLRRVLREKNVRVVPVEVDMFSDDRHCRFGLDMVSACGDDVLAKKYKMARKEGIESLVVILMHGIRTRAAWLHEVKRELGRAGLLAITTSYGKFDLFRFLAPFHWTKSSAVRRIQNRVQETKDVWPGKKIVVIAHSFGTYVVGRLIAGGEQFHRCVFCGSVLRQDFPFPQRDERFVLNEIGSRDFWPVAASKLNALYGVTGSFGFDNGVYVEDRFHAEKDHSAFLNAEFARRFWVPYLCDGEIVAGVSSPTFSFIQRAVDAVPQVWAIGRFAGVIASVGALACLGRWWFYHK